MAASSCPDRRYDSIFARARHRRFWHSMAAKAQNRRPVIFSRLKISQPGGM
jgi:hypothetical protein